MIINLLLQVLKLRARVRVLELDLLEQKVQVLDEESLEHRVHRLEYFMLCLFPGDE